MALLVQRPDVTATLLGTHQYIAVWYVLAWEELINRPNASSAG